MSSDDNQKAKNYFKELMKKAKGAVNVVVGAPEAYSEEDAGGQLRFDPARMMKINVTFDKEFLPKEKVVKLNVRGKRFFNELKRDLRVINSIYVVYPSEYVIQFDVRRDEWEKRLIQELNSEYKLDLRKIHFVNEEDICSMYQRQGINHVRNPYNLQKGELLILVGGFANFDMDSSALFDVKITLKRESEEKEGRVVKNNFEAKFFDKYDERAGAYFFVGGEWFHNIFVPEMFQDESPRYFSFRLAGEAGRLKFFSDLKMRGVDIIEEEKKPIQGDDFVETVHVVNTAYLGETGIVDFKLSTIVYDTGEEEAPEEETAVEEPQPVETPEPAAEEETPGVPVKRMEIQPVSMERAASTAEEETNFAAEDLPYLESEMILLPLPREDDIASYILSIGNDKKSLKFYASCADDEVSILAPEREEKVYKRKINERVDYSIKLDSLGYSVSNTLLSRIDDKELKLYFAWALKSTDTERIPLGESFYIFGREPLENLDRQPGAGMYDQLVRLNKGDQDFWRIGASRDHALLLKSDKDYRLYNISCSYPVYVLNDAKMEQAVVRPSRIEAVSGAEKQETLERLLAAFKDMSADTSQLRRDLDSCAHSAALAHNDLVIIGSRVYRYIVPRTMESSFNDRAQKSILRKIQLNQSIIRK
jgi:hypothetical protein